jgi:cell division septation protein DedD
VLSPDGYEPESSIGQGIAAAMERGIPLVGVVRERWTPATAPPPGRISAARAGAPRRRARPAVVAVTLALGTAGGWALLARGAPQPFAVAPAPPRRPAAVAPAAPSQPTPAAPPAVRAPHRDSLPWTVQLIAYARLDKALGLADRIGAAGIVPFVTPVAIGPRRSTIWYRVLAGGYRTRDSALAARAVLWNRGLARRGQGDVLRAPYSYAVSGPVSADELRARGIPAVSRAGDGHFWVGAFETPEQANVLATRLRRAGVQATLVTRMGTTP